MDINSDLLAALRDQFERYTRCPPPWLISCAGRFDYDCSGKIDSEVRLPTATVWNLRGLVKVELNMISLNVAYMAFSEYHVCSAVLLNPLRLGDDRSVWA